MSYVLVTHFDRPGHEPIVHAYGPFATRAKAQTVRRRMLRDVQHHAADVRSRLDTRVTKVLEPTPVSDASYASLDGTS